MAALIDDLRHMTAAWDDPPSRVVLGALVRLPLHPRFGVVIRHRAASWCWHHRLRPVALWLQAMSIRAAGAEIHPAARFGSGLSISHPVGIVVGHEVVAGDNLVIYQGVTLGHTGTGPGQPRIGDNVRIGAGAKLLGPVDVGDGAWIGANAVVLADVPAGALATGVWRG
jgi:serine O-acetyltransferase